MFDERIRLIEGDITKLKVDVIVNAANSTLLGGGGVDGAIHRAAGKGLLEECRSLGGCPTGEAKITQGYNLPAKFVIHTVGPIWHGGNKNEEELLRNCYFNSLTLATANNLTTIAFPSISTGVYGFPFERACTIALKTVNEFLRSNKQIDEVVFVTFSQKDFISFKNLMENASLS